MRRSPLRWIIPLLLALQLGLLWIQGAQLHRQNQVLQALREDLQALTDSLENNQGPVSSEDGSGTVPAGRQARRSVATKLAVLGAEEEQEAASKELKASRDSAQKAVKEAREVQSKLSIQENARKVDEARKVQTATRSWSTWVLPALALVVGAFLVRAFLQRRS